MMVKILGVSSLPQDPKMRFGKRLPEEVISRLGGKMFHFKPKKTGFYYLDCVTGILSQLIQLKRLARKSDLILCFIPQLLPFCFLMRKPIVFVAVDNYEGVIYSRKFKKMVYYGIKRFLLPHVQAIVGTTNYIAQNYKHLGEKVYTIRVGVDTQFFRPEKNFEPHTKAHYILYYHGKLREDYNIDLLIKSLQYISHPVSLWLVGDGPERKNLEKLTQDLDLNHKVHFLGSQPYESLPGIMHESDIFLNPISECGSKLYQYFSAKRPVISLWGKVEEIAIHKSHFMCCKKDPQEWGKTVDLLLADHYLQKKLVKRAYLSIIHQDWEIITRMYEQLIRRVLFKLCMYPERFLDRLIQYFYHIWETVTIRP